MPLTAQVESLTAGMAEWAALHQEAHEELSLDQDKVPLDVDFATYRKLDANGLITYVTLRDERRLVGFFVGTVFPSLHYQSTPMAEADALYVHPSVRGRLGGLRLLRATERELRRRGVKRWVMAEMLHKPSGRLFKAAGFAPIERRYSLWLGA